MVRHVGIFLRQVKLLNFKQSDEIMSTPPQGGGRHIVLLLSASASSLASASHQLLRHPLLKFFLGGMFFVPQVIGFLFLL